MKLYHVMQANGSLLGVFTSRPRAMITIREHLRPRWSSGFAHENESFYEFVDRWLKDGAIEITEIEMDRNLSLECDHLVRSPR